MRTRIITILAALLLISTGAFAQSSNIDPTRCDVNQDGTVDVADITAILKCMKEAGGAVGEKMCYWYVGAAEDNAVRADNFTDIATRIQESELPTTGEVTADNQYVYLVMPNTWHLETLVDAHESAVEVDCTDAFGYHIYKTKDKMKGVVKYCITKTIYYWYIGQTQPTAVNQPSAWRISNKDGGFTETITIPAGYTWFAYPNTWTYTAKDSSGDDFAFNAFVPATTKTSISGYILLKGPKMSSGDTITITFSK